MVASRSVANLYHPPIRCAPCHADFHSSQVHADTIPPSPTPLTTAATAPTPTNILFAPGTTAAVEQGTVLTGQVVTYTLIAEQSQPLILLLYSPNYDVTLEVLEPDGNNLLDPASQLTRWMGLLPRLNLYTIQVIGGAMTENHTLTAKVRQTVNFASGATSVTLNGTTVFVSD